MPEKLDGTAGLRVVVARAPGRVNLIGEHTDYNGGLALPCAIQLGTTARLRRRDDARVRLTSRQAEDSWEGTLDELGPGRLVGWTAYAGGVLWALREAGWPVPGMEVEVDGDVPLGAGLSSSAALSCSVATGVAGLVGRELTDEVRHELVAVCRRAETEVAGAPTGGLDQTAAMFSRRDEALLIDFSDGSLTHVPLRIEEARLVVLVTDTRVHHTHAGGGYATRRAECERGDPRRMRHVHSENDRVRAAVSAIGDDDWATFGGLMSASHASLRDDFEVSSPELDLAVETAVSAGALGARMTGGGFGGSAISLVAADRAKATRRAVEDAFAAAGLTAPQHHVALPSDAAGVVLAEPGPTSS